MTLKGKKRKQQKELNVRLHLRRNFFRLRSLQEFQVFLGYVEGSFGSLFVFQFFVTPILNQNLESYCYVAIY